MRFLSFILIFSLLLCGCGVNKDDITSSNDSDVVEDSQVLPELTVIFGDVGKADFILLSCGGEYAVIDAGACDGTDCGVHAWSIATRCQYAYAFKFVFHIICYYS